MKKSYSQCRSLRSSLLACLLSLIASLSLSLPLHAAEDAPAQNLATAQNPDPAPALQTEATTGSSTPAARVNIRNPARSYDVQIGDVLTRQLEILLPAQANIAKENLPRKGSKLQGIELVNVHTEQTQQGGQRKLSLQLQYQVFASSDKPSVMQLPELNLPLEGSDQTLNVPAWPFWFSPLVVSNASKAGINMQPQFQAPLLDSTHLQAWLLGFVALTALGVLALVYINAEKKWLPFMGGAFAVAHRKIKRLKPSPEGNKEAFYHMHAAFNTWYGGNCFAQDIEQFVQQNPRFGRSREQIARFFACSNDYLFLDQAQSGDQTMQELKQLSKQLRHCERGVA